MKHNTWESSYLMLCRAALNYGELVKTRVGFARSLLGQSLPIFLGEGQFPLLTTRRMYPKPVLGELCAFLEGASKLADFKRLGCNYWDANANAWPRNDGRPESTKEVGKIYGYQWRNFNSDGYDQVEEVIRQLVEDPTSRRIIMTAWNPLQLEDMCLPPCHIITQFHSRERNRSDIPYLDCSVYMRSVDLALGLPSDIILYYALMIFIAERADHHVGSLYFHFGDAHVYSAHEAALRKQLERSVMAVPQYRYMPEFGWKPESIQFSNYNPKEPIQYELLA